MYPNYEKKDVMIENGTIKALENPGIIQNAEVIDLSGKPLLPGFTDCHTHLNQWGLSLSGPHLGDAQSKEESLQIISDFMSKNPSFEHFVACDYDESFWSEKAGFSKNELDSISPKKPLVARRICGHLAVANTSALAYIDSKKSDYQNFSPEMIDRKSGVLKEIPVLRINEIFPPGEKLLESALKNAVKKYHSFGVTSVGEITSNSSRRKILNLDGLKMKFRFAAVEKNFDDCLKNKGEIDEIIALKIFLDGSIGARTAAVSFKWTDDENSGFLLMDSENINSYVIKALDHGKMVWSHAIGDRAIRQILDVYENFNPEDRKHFRIEHFELPRLDDIKRASDLGIFLSMQPNFIRAWSGPGGLYENCIPQDVYRNNNPISMIQNLGGRICFGSDTMPPGPFWGIKGTVNAWLESQRITTKEAIEYYTLHSAQSLEDLDRGEIAKGYRADLIVLSVIPDQDNLDEVRVEKVFIDGEIAYG